LEIDAELVDELAGAVDIGDLVSAS